MTNKSLFLSVLFFVASPSLVSAQPGGAPAVPAPESEETTKATVSKVQSFYDKTTTFKADFTQVYTAKLYNKTTTSSGTVVFSKPGKMSFDYATPKGNRMVSDGQTLRVYQVDQNQVFEQAAGKTEYPAALSFLTGTGKLADSFTFKQYNGTAFKYEGGIVLQGTPKTPSPAYETVYFYVDPPSSQIRRVLIRDKAGNTNSFSFSNAKVNEAVAASAFQFVVPSGATIVKP